MADKPEQDNEPQEQTTPTDAAWQSALAALREAVQLGLPAKAARAEIARELARVVRRLRANAEPAPPPQPKPARVPTVQVKYQARYVFPYQVRLDRDLWQQVGRPRRVTLSATPHGWRVVSVWGAGQPGAIVTEDKTSPFFRGAEQHLHGLTVGVYRIELVQGAMMIRERLESGEPME